jgi:hypothetical protein
MTAARRWDDDSRGRGIAGAPDLAPEARQLADALDLADWIAEEPEAHLVPHIERACAAPESSVELAGWSVDAHGTLVVRLLPRAPLDRRARRSAAYAVIAAVGESRALIRELPDGDSWDVVTGVLDGDTDFAAHGHRLRLIIEGVGAPPAR